MTDTNPQAMQDFYRFWETASETLLDASTHTDLIDHDRDPMAEGTDYEALLGIAQAVSGLSDLTHDFVHVHHDDDKIIVRWNATGEHTGDVFGHPATGNTVYFGGHDILQLRDGKIAELWHSEQLLQLTAQMQ